MTRSRLQVLTVFTMLSVIAPIGLLPAHSVATSALMVRPDSAVVRNEGGFVPVEYHRSSLPSVYVAANAMYLPAAITMMYPGPAVNPVEQRTVRISSLRTALRGLYAAAKAPTGGWGTPNVADAPATTVSVTVDGRTRTVSVYALGIGSGPGVSTKQQQARTKLLSAIRKLESLKGASSMYRPLKLEAWPSSAHTTVKNPEGSSPLPGTNPGDEPIINPYGPDLPWFTSTMPEGCTVVDAAALPQDANQATTWVAGGDRFTVTFRVVLPGEIPCGKRR